MKILLIIWMINENINQVDNLDLLYTSKDFGWDLIKQDINFRQVPYFINLYTSRGCKYNCSFCYLKDIHQLGIKNRFRRRSVENIIREIEYLHNTFGINVVTFGDDDFLFDIKKVLPIFEYLKKRQIYIEHIWTNIYN
ncbi:MAG: radical SAM protein, partial [Gammaproteobacteria bacterium]|nr:radical SAM protein [Gammaproteobacteria bacterium]